MSDGIFGHPGSPLVAGLEAVVVAALLFGFGFMVVTALDRKQRLATFDRAALAFPTVVAYALVLMLLHVASGGRVLSNGSLVVALTLVLGITCTIIVRRAPERTSGRDWFTLVVALGALALWALPTFRLLPLFAGGDPGLHAGWTNQLLVGEALPTSPVPGDIPNYYPWLFHALLALITHFTPGGNAYLAFGPLQLLQPIALALALFALGRRLFGSLRAGCATALFGALAGGIGFFWSRGPEVVMHPSDPGAADTYAGDLLFVRGPALAFTNLAPPFPRDVALTLLVTAVLLVLLGLRRADSFLLVASGIVLGMVGLTGAEPFFVGVAFVALAIVRGSPPSMRLRWFALGIGTAVALYLVWAGPLLYNYFRLDGFVNTSEIAPVDLPWYGFLGAWGIALPFALLGLVGVARRVWRETTSIFLILSIAVPVAALVVASFVPRVLGEGFNVLGRGHRYWPLLSLGVALVAAAGFTRVTGRLPRRAAVGMAAATAAIAVASPLLATIAVIDETPRVAVLRAALEGDTDTVFERLAEIGSGCTVAGRVESSLTFAYTGHRHIAYVWRADRDNDARIRWKRALEELPDDAERAATNRRISNGIADVEEWNDLVAGNEVDVIVTRPASASAPPFDSLEGTEVRGAAGEPVVVYQVDECG